jgi:predicted RNA methylase
MKNQFDELLPSEIANGDVAITSEVVPWHFPMMNDNVRNDAYENALKTALLNGGTVLDIGSGSGLLSMMAARHGANHITTCEVVSMVAEKAKIIIERNGFKNQIQVINKLSTNLIVGEDIPNKADILVTEIFDNGLLGEFALSAISHARKNLLEPEAKIIPAGAKVYAILIDSDEIYKNHRVEKISNFDLSPFNQFSTYGSVGYHLDKMNYSSLSEVTSIFEFDFYQDKQNESKSISFDIIKSGTAHAIAFWYELQVDSQNTISTAPNLPQLSCWKQSVQLFNLPRTCQSGTAVRLTAHHDEETIWFTAT